MSKKKFISIMLMLAFIVSLLTILNYDKIFTYLTNRKWEIADSIGRIELDNYLNIIGTDSNLLAINSSGIQGFSENANKIFEQAASFKEVISATAGDYAIVAEKNSTSVYVINKDKMVWNDDINNANILSVKINKNGYSAVTYSQAGYKSLIKVYSSTGEELFTSYFASTYAIDVAISNDNKTLAIAEIDTNGVSLVSAIKIINIQTASNEEVKKYDLEKDELVSNAEFDQYNHLIIMTDIGVKTLKNDNILEILNFKEENITQCTIDDSKKIVAIKIVEEGLFSVKCFVCIYDVTSNDVKKYELTETPNNVAIYNDVVAVNMGNKIIFLNSGGNFLKKCEYNGQLKDMVLFNDGNTAALIFRNYAELIKVGGI